MDANKVKGRLVVRCCVINQTYVTFSDCDVISETEGKTTDVHQIV